MAKKATSLHSIINELVERSNSDTQRIRALEQKEDNMASRLEVIEKDMISMNESVLKLGEQTVANFKKRDAVNIQLQGTIKEIIKQLKRLASAEKINELEAMIDIYNPLKSNFMTKEEVESLISDKLEKLPKKQ